MKLSYDPAPRTDMTLRQDKRIKVTHPTGSETAPSILQTRIPAHHASPMEPGARAASGLVPDVLEFYPDTRLALRLWNVYIKSVDPVLKILHIPSVQSTVVATILDPSSAPSSTLALTFAIYFAAVTALCHDKNKDPIDLPLETLERYRRSLDRLLMVPDLMDQPDLTALQALAIYVVSLEAGPGSNRATELE